MVAHIFPQVKVNETVKLFKSYHPDYRDGWQLRDFVWVGDCVNVVLWLLDHPEVSGLFQCGVRGGALLLRSGEGGVQCAGAPGKDRLPGDA